MTVVRDTATNSYHGFVSQFLNKCKLGSWTTNSYVNHIISDSPTGPWSQAGVALPAWSHNPRIVWSARDRTWVLYHIGSAANDTVPKRCDGGNGGETASGTGATATAPQRGPTPAPFNIHYSKSLGGPWTRLSPPTPPPPPAPRFTAYPGLTNVPPPPPSARGGVTLFEDSMYGGGRLHLLVGGADSAFVPNPRRGGVLAWDGCGGAVFDNGHPVQDDAVGSRIGAFEVTGDAVLWAGDPCDLTFKYPNASVVLRGPYNSSSGRSARSSVNYFEQVRSAMPAGVISLGETEDAEGCRGGCELDSRCTSYTWLPLPAGVHGGRCMGRTDQFWFPNASSHSTVSGRPWSFDGDNPAPVLDPVTGEARVLYRCDSKAGTAGAYPTGYRVASLIGIATAPSWRGPYSAAGAFGGSISTNAYPFDENEDPFLWKSARGWHGIFHANTWVDSRGATFPVARSEPLLSFFWRGRPIF